MGVSLFPDDGVIWKRGRNIRFIMTEVQRELQKRRIGLWDGDLCSLLQKQKVDYFDIKESRLAV